MAGVQTLELEIQVNMTAERFFKTFKKKEGNFTDKTEAVSVHRDDPTSNSSIQIWNFIVDGKMEQIKEKIEVDEENKSVSFVALDGDVLKQYKTYKITLDVVPKDDQVCIAKWTWEYEKLNDDVPPPTRYTAFVADYTRDLETRLLSES
ncbi:Bet v I/Major latex protein [Arabidopsis thaliana x Arabidopsis arenosa]|uniref:Bet v I/Major latex protein n=1 Tax=Arabidopsis thaliana x Arabidopsis arenosa TaxID=1240361 RepID=A0A8T2C2R1_9BRAS|nr:Bet v I/Major latex protein [Arabidopsis thaliana x Arabidopsis arenosa]